MAERGSIGVDKSTFNIVFNTTRRRGKWSTLPAHTPMPIITYPVIVRGMIAPPINIHFTKVIKNRKPFSYSNMTHVNTVLPNLVMTVDHAPGRVLFQKIATWAYGSNTLMDTSGYLAGTAKNGATILAGCKIRLYYKSTGALIDEKRADNQGRFRFDFLEVGKSNYTIIAYIDGDYNAVCLDNLVPLKG